MGQGLDDTCGIWTASKLSEGIEHRVVRFFAPETFDALSTRCSYIPLTRSLPMERVHERGFSDARLSSNKNYLPLTTQGLLKRGLQITQRTCPADHLRCDVE